MDALLQHLFADGFLSLRMVVRLLLLSGLFTVVCLLAFPRNAPSRRLLLIAAISTLAVFPLVLSAIDAHWYLTLERIPIVTFATSLPNILLWVWWIVALLLIVAHMLRVTKELKALAAQPKLADPSLQMKLANMANDMGVAVPNLRLGHQACSSTLIAPTLALPEQWSQWDEKTLRSVLAHELTHIKRYDDRWLVLARLMVLSYWWMPWLKRLYASYQRVMEESCDDAASEYVEHPHLYVGALVSVARVASRPLIQNENSSLVNMKEHHLVGRVDRFNGPRGLELDTSSIYWWVIVVLLAVMLLTGIEPVLPSVRPSVADITYHPQIEQKAPDAAIYPVVIDFTRVPDTARPGDRQRIYKPATQIKAIYPGTAIRRGLEENVIVEFSVADDGGVIFAEVLTHLAHQHFQQSALRAVRQTRYSPAQSQILNTRNWATKTRTNHLRRGIQSRRTKPPTGLLRIQRHFGFRLSSELLI